jgi:hypothetical protein
MPPPYIEQDCTIHHEGRTYESGGAVITDDYAVGYLKLHQDRGRRGIVTTWHGQELGPARVTASWPILHTGLSDRMHQVEATINGITYTGRSQGDGMIWRGKRKKRG